MSSPISIGVILDGNRRYAKEKGLPSLEGHRQGFLKFKEFLNWAREANVQYVTAYAFSTENWKRTNEEVSYLLDLFRLMISKHLREMEEKNGVIRFIGDRSRFPEDLQTLMQETEERTTKNTGLTLVIALSYGGRGEIVRAAEKLLKSRAGDVSTVTEEEFEKHLDTIGIPDPDLIIRTGGAIRTSNFLPWQSAYSELFFVPTYWPAFSKEEFNAILREYAERERRFGA